MSTLADEMAANALEAQKFTRKHLVTELDLSPESVEELELQFDLVEYAIKGGKSPENIELLTRIWGSYLGEVMRRLGGEWVQEESEGTRRLAIRGKNQMLYPHDQVRQRLTGGVQHNVWAYFQQVRASL